MTEKKFFASVVNGRKDIVDLMLQLLKDTDSDYCLIGGLAVNAYTEPLVSLDLDLVVAAKNISTLCHAAEKAGLRVEKFPHSINLSTSLSDLRVQLQSDSAYQSFIPRSSEKQVLGYTLKVAQLEDVFSGKVWAYSDPSRRQSKRQKDLADISRLIESHPHLAEALPEEIRKLLI